MSAEDQNSVIETASMVVSVFALAQRGFRAIALPPGAKAPPRQGWPDRATTQRSRIAETWEAQPSANVGYILDNLVALTSTRWPLTGMDGEATWATLTAGRSVPPTWTVTTPSGGRHLVFALPVGWSVTARDSGLGPGVDVKSGAGAYLAGPGSVTAAGIYSLADDADPAPMPDWLGDELRAAGLLRTAQTRHADSTIPYVAPARPWSPLGAFGTPIPAGQRHGVLRDYVCSLRARRTSRVEAEVLLRQRWADCEQPEGRPFGWGEAEALLADIWARHPSGTGGDGGDVSPSPAGSGPPEDGAGLLDDVAAFVARFVVLPSEAALTAVVLWLAHTHAVDAAESTPRLALLSPEPSSGKTRVLEIADLLVPSPMHAVNATPAALFRSVKDAEDGKRPTILYDEIDTVFGPRARDNEEVRGLINAGHRRGAVAYRCVGEGTARRSSRSPLSAPSRWPGSVTCPTPPSPARW